MWLRSVLYNPIALVQSHCLTPKGGIFGRRLLLTNALCGKFGRRNGMSNLSFIICITCQTKLLFGIVGRTIIWCSWIFKGLLIKVLAPDLVHSSEHCCRLSVSVLVSPHCSTNNTAYIREIGDIFNRFLIHRTLWLSLSTGRHHFGVFSELISSANLDWVNIVLVCSVSVYSP